MTMLCKIKVWHDLRSQFHKWLMDLRYVTPIVNMQLIHHLPMHPRHPGLHITIDS